MNNEIGSSRKLTRAETAAFLGKSERMVANYVKDNKLQATYGEGSTRSILLFDSDEVAEFKARLDSGAVIAIDAPEIGNEETGNRKSTKQETVKHEIGSEIVPISRNVKQETGNTPTASYFIISDEQLGNLVGQQSRVALEPSNLVAKYLLTIPEAMELSGIKEKPIRDAIKAGNLKSIRIGRSTQVRPEDLKRWVDSQFAE